jgi:protein-S-isoprenylcysteine O-methyltransferase Ste14
MKTPKVLPPVYLILSIVLMGALHFFFPVVRFLQPPFTYLGVVLIVAGIAISAYASGLFAKAGTPVIPFKPSTALVTTGLYRWTRNPMYLGTIIILLGLAMFCGTAGSLLPVPFYIWLIRARFVVREERFLEDIFGERYLEYKRSVRRWL